MRRPPFHSTSILNAGSLNLKTGNSTHFNVIDNCYGRPGALFLVKELSMSQDDVYHVYSGSGRPENYKNFAIGERPTCHHDQSGRVRVPITVIASGETSLETMTDFMSIINTKGTKKASVRFAVFK